MVCLFLVDNNFLILFFSENAAIIVPDIEFPKHKNNTKITQKLYNNHNNLHNWPKNLYCIIIEIYFQFKDLSLLTANKHEINMK
jgi:hypothetical protein